MTGALLWLILIAVGMGLIGLLAFLWSLSNGQMEDLDGAAERLLHQSEDVPVPQRRLGQIDAGQSESGKR